jgi:hypothetical protein
VRFSLGLEGESIEPKVLIVVLRERNRPRHYGGPVILDAPFLDLDRCIVERNKDVLVEAFFPQAALKLSICAFWIGLPGSINCSRTPWSLAH